MNDVQDEPGKRSGNIDLSHIYNSLIMWLMGQQTDWSMLVLAKNANWWSRKIVNVTINTFVSFSGDIEMCHIKGITSHMVHTDINNLFVSAMENSVQDQMSLQATLSWQRACINLFWWRLLSFFKVFSWQHVILVQQWIGSIPWPSWYNIGNTTIGSNQSVPTRALPKVQEEYFQ